MNIKRSWVIGVVVLMTLGTARTQAADMNSYAQCSLVPLAYYDSEGATTAVGLTSRLAGTIHWLFFDQNGARLDYGNFQQPQSGR